MDFRYRIVIGAMVVFVSIAIYSLAYVTGNQDSASGTEKGATDAYTGGAFSNSSLLIGNPVIHRETLEFTGVSVTDFIAFEDFPIDLDRDSVDAAAKLSVVNTPDYAWTKLITYDDRTQADEEPDLVLRVMGAVKPNVVNNFNATLYIVESQEGQLLGFSSMPVVKNGIIREIAVVTEDIPIRFKTEILTSNYNSPYIFGLIYDNNRFSPYSQSSIIDSTLEVNIEPVGLMVDGKLEEFPEWLKVETIKLPISLTNNNPDYYGILIITSDAPVGSHEIAFREIVNDRIFLETMTVTVIG